MRKVLFGGEQASSKHVKKALAVLGEHRLINGYGPTETTVFACTHSVDRRVEGQRTIPIGKPLSNTTCYVLDRQGRPQPIGVPGELWIGGDGVARGYLNRPELTAERFVENPLVPGERLYRSGDLVRWLPGGELEYLGRIDDQVKIRGHRIEPGEVEACLLKHPLSAGSSTDPPQVLLGKLGLFAYLVGEDGAWSPRELRSFMARSLPDHMIPSYFGGVGIPAADSQREGGSSGASGADGTTGEGKPLRKTGHRGGNGFGCRLATGLAVGARRNPGQLF